MHGMPQCLLVGGNTPGAAIFAPSDADYVDVPPIDSITQYSYCGWARVHASAADGFHFAFSEGKNSGEYFGAGVQMTGGVCTAFIGQTGNSTSGTVFCPDADRWFFFAVRKNNTSIEGMWCYLEDSSFDPNRVWGDESSFGASAPVRATAGAVRTSGPSSLGLHGDFCQIRRWKASLNDTEFLAEKDSPTVVRATNLFSSNPFHGVADMTDESGNGRTGTAVGAVADASPGPGN